MEKASGDGEIDATWARSSSEVSVRRAPPEDAGSAHWRRPSDSRNLARAARRISLNGVPAATGSNRTSLPRAHRCHSTWAAAGSVRGSEAAIRRIVPHNAGIDEPSGAHSDDSHVADGGHDVARSRWKVGGVTSTPAGVDGSEGGRVRWYAALARSAAYAARHAPAIPRTSSARASRGSAIADPADGCAEARFATWTTRAAGLSAPPLRALRARAAAYPRDCSMQRESLFDVDDGPMMARRQVVMVICLIQVCLCAFLTAIGLARRAAALLVMQPFFAAAGALGYYGARKCVIWMISAHFLGSSGLSLVLGLFIIAQSFLKRSGTDLLFFALNFPMVRAARTKPARHTR